MESIVLRISDRSGEDAASVQVTSDAANFKAIEFPCFLGHYEIADLANDLRLSVFQKRGMARETGHGRLRILSRLPSERLEILRKRPDKILGGEGARVKRAAPLLKMLRVARTALPRWKRAAMESGLVSAGR
jgi:hypothetical protein